MSASSTIFINNLTVVDFSAITEDGMIVGGSAYLDVSLQGPLVSGEEVVVDFSEGKRQIKDYIDGPEGFDHKCWINTLDPKIIVTQQDDIVRVQHTTSGLRVEGPADAFAFVTSNIEADIAEFLNQKMSPIVVTDVGLRTGVYAPLTANVAPAMFKYVHGLKSSTSYGCKNIAHGHKSFISARVAGQEPSMAHTMLLRSIAQDLNNAIFAHTDDLRYDEQSGEYVVEYTTPERGHMSMHFKQKVIALETQTTIEHIIEYVRARYYDQFKAYGIVELFVSEGLCKGASLTV